MLFTCSYDTSSSDGFFVLFSSVVIVESNYFGFGARHSIENRFVEGPAWVQHGSSMGPTWVWRDISDLQIRLRVPD